MVTPHAGVWIETDCKQMNGCRCRVTPHAGVWIETWNASIEFEGVTSLPMRECGLKLKPGSFHRQKLVVTPHAGVWIETIWLLLHLFCCLVTPHAGVWIETLVLDRYSN